MSERTKEAMVDLAIESIRESGIDNLSLRKISEKVGLTTGAFYKSFKNKDELLVLVTKKISHQVYKDFAIDEKETNILDPRENLIDLGMYLASKFINDPNIMNFLFFSDVSVTTIRTSEDEYELLDLVEELIQKVIQENNLSIDDETLFLQIWSFLQGYILLIRNRVIDVNREFLAETLDKLLREN